jgi:hypothetical protein
MKVFSLSCKEMMEASSVRRCSRIGCSAALAYARTWIERKPVHVYMHATPSGTSIICRV